MTTNAELKPAGGSPASPATDKFSFIEVIAVLAILSGAFMVVLDFFVVIVALPSIQQELSASHAMLGLVVAGYAAATAAGLVAGGMLGDHFGRKKMLLIGLALFTLASVGCGLARSPLELVLMRVLQGLAGALVQPQVLALLGVSFTGHKRSRVFAWYSMAMGLAGVAAQFIGGLVIEANWGGLGWRGCFLINLPVGLAGLVLTGLAVRETARQNRPAWDVPGILLIAAALGSLILGLTLGRDAEGDGPGWSLTAFAAAAICALLFVWHERRLYRRGGSPVIPASLWAAPGYRLGVLAVFVFYGGVASLYFVLALHLQQTLGMTPVASGLMFAVLGVAFFAASMLGSRRAWARKPAAMLWGAGLLGSGHLWQMAVALLTLSEPWLLLPGLLAQGTGIGLIMAPLVARVLAAAPARHTGVASGVLATFQQVGNALGVALISALYAAGSVGTAATTARAASSGFSLSMVYLMVMCAALCAVLWRWQARAQPRN